MKRRSVGFIADESAVRQGGVNLPVFVETLLLGGLATMLLLKARQGELVLYIHPRYIWLAVTTGVALLLVSVVRATAISSGPAPLTRRHAYYLLLAVPLCIGSLLPGRPLGSQALAGSALGASVRPVEQRAPSAESTWTLLDWVTALNVRPSDTIEREVDVIGFVYRPPDRVFDGFYVARYVITCCVADGSGVGLPVVWANSTELSADTWVRVRGQIGQIPIGEATEPGIIATSVEVVPRPANPYLTP
jgi:uncharacterized repeat protein (TIGR03943 family)